jgi:XTP/dITP diphosphohydrolase
MKIVLASNNQGKIKEIRLALKALPITLISQAELNIPEVEETGLTFVENALLKARHAAEQSGYPALADDSGLAVNFLQGAPGIYSARFAGKKATDAENNQLLLEKLQNVPLENRGAIFYCTMVLMNCATDPIPLICNAQWEGTIVTDLQGTAGFGYDPLFFIASEQKTAAELTPDLKNTISHRGKALAALRKQIEAKLATTIEWNHT